MANFPNFIIDKSYMLYNSFNNDNNNAPFDINTNMNVMKVHVKLQLNEIKM